MNNTGYGGHGLFEQASDEDVRAMFETNVFGPMNVMCEALPEMRVASRGNGQPVHETGPIPAQNGRFSRLWNARR